MSQAEHSTNEVLISSPTPSPSFPPNSEANLKPKPSPPPSKDFVHFCKKKNYLKPDFSNQIKPNAKPEFSFLNRFSSPRKNSRLAIVGTLAFST
jgi:hypothetical protein